MATIYLPGYALTSNGAGKGLDWFGVEYRVVLPGNSTVLTYRLDPDGNVFPDIVPEVLEVDGFSLLSDLDGNAFATSLDFATVSAGGFEADIAVISSDRYQPSFHIWLDGDGRSDDAGRIMASVLGSGDADYSRIRGGPFAADEPIDLGRITGARVTQDDRIFRADPSTGSDAEDDDVFTGAGRDRVSLAGGDDRASLGAGHDWARGGDGSDRLFGGRGDDRLFGDAGSDRLLGEAGDDALAGGRGRDALFGGAGRDLLDGGRGGDRLRGGDGADLLDGAAGNDVLFGDRGGDTLRGGDGDDGLLGGAGRDALRGGDGDDVLTGGAGGDALFGGRGDDLMAGGSGDDTLAGGRGDDVFLFTGGDDSIADFALRGGVDTVLIRAGMGRDMDAIREGAIMGEAGLVLDFGRAGSLTYEGRNLDDLGRILNEDNFAILTISEFGQFPDF